MVKEAANIEVLYDTLRAVPEATVGEIIDGRLYAQPRPSAVHSDVQLGIGGDLKAVFDWGRDGPGGWRILTEPEVHFERDVQVLVPYLAGWRRERMPQLPDDQRIEIGPDWVCEIPSPSTASKDRETKMPVYARYGVTHAWIIDPRAETLEAFALQADALTLVVRLSGDDEIWVPPFGDRGVAPPWA